MRVLVLGGAGYIGSHVVYQLLDNHHEVVVFDNLSTGHKEILPKEAKFYFGDITNYKALCKVFKKEKIDVVMDFAAKIVVPESMQMPLEYYHNNFEGVRLIIKAMHQYGIKKLVFSSTAAVYGNPQNGVCFEDDMLNPINPYGESKLAAEKLIKWAHQAYGIDYVIFRYFNVAGSDAQKRCGLISNSLTHIIPIVTEAMLKIRPHVAIYGNDYNTSDGTCVRDYIHVSDLAHAHILGALHLVHNKKSVILNLGSNTGFSVLEVIKTANDITPFNYEFAPRRAGDPAVLIANSKRAQEILNFTPTKTLQEMIKSDYDFRGTYHGK